MAGAKLCTIEFNVQNIVSVLTIIWKCGENIYNKCFKLIILKKFIPLSEDKNLFTNDCLIVLVILLAMCNIFLQ